MSSNYLQHLFIKGKRILIKGIGEGSQLYLKMLCAFQDSVQDWCLN